MRCLAQYNLLAGMTLDPALYPLRCFDPPTTPCFVDVFDPYPGPVTFVNTMAETRGHRFTFPMSPSHTITASAWSNDDWRIRIWSIDGGAIHHFRGSLDAGAPSTTILGVDDTEWLLCHSSGGANSLDVLMT